MQPRGEATFSDFSILWFWDETLFDEESNYIAIASFGQQAVLDR